MPTGSFDAWFHGVPLELNLGDSRTFAYWFHGVPALRPDITAVLVSTTFQMRARIALTNTKNFQARARIRATVDQTISLRAHIRNSVTRQLKMRARLSRRQGWPILGPFDPGFDSFQPTQLTMRARLLQGTRASQGLDMRASIFHRSTALLQVRARIVKAVNLSMRARIKPRRARSRAIMTYYVSRESQTRVLMLFYTQGNFAEQTMSMRARIVHAQQTRVTGTFVIGKTGSGASVLGFGFDSTQLTLQQLRMGARIVAL